MPTTSRPLRRFWERYPVIQAYLHEDEDRAAPAGASVEVLGRVDALVDDAELDTTVAMSLLAALQPAHLGVSGMVERGDGHAVDRARSRQGRRALRRRLLRHHGRPRGVVRAIERRRDEQVVDSRPMRARLVVAEFLPGLVDSSVRRMGVPLLER